VRLLAAGDTDKNDPSGARSVAIAALRPAGVRQVVADDHPAVLKLWSKRYRDLGRTRTQVVCRLHAVLCELIPGGVSTAITAPAATRLLDAIEPAGAVDAARCELAADFLDDLRRIDGQLRETRKRLTVCVQAAGTSLTGLSGVGPVIAAAVIGDVKDVSRFPGRDHVAAYDGTAPIEVSSGQRKVYRLSRRGNRRLNHAIHMAAVTQIRHRHSKGRAYYDKKLAGGKTRKEALRSLKRQVSNAIFACLQAGARRAAARAEGPGGQPGNDSAASAAGLHPGNRLFGQAAPGPCPPTLRPRPSALPARADPAIPRSLPPGRWRRRRSRRSARSEARTNDLEVRRDDGHTRPRGWPPATIGWPEHSARRAHHAQGRRPAEPLDTKRHSLCAPVPIGWRGGPCRTEWGDLRGWPGLPAAGCAEMILWPDVVREAGDAAGDGAANAGLGDAVVERGEDVRVARHERAEADRRTRWRWPAPRRRTRSLRWPVRGSSRPSPVRG
jgi:transposase